MNDNSRSVARPLMGLLALLPLLAACSSGGGGTAPAEPPTSGPVTPTPPTPPPDPDPVPDPDPDPDPTPDPDPDPLPIPPPSDSVEFVELTNRTLDADGDQVGLDTYDLIRDFGGPRPIEAPDLYPINHPEVRHIYEDTDTEVGNHFVFIIHRDIDIDRDRVENDDRQRNEIKTYASSEEAVKGYENETFIYRWKFKINADMEVSRRFTHLFQLKAVGGEDGMPILTISGAERSGEDGIEVRHSPLRDTTILGRSDWGAATGEWLEAYCRVTFSDSAELRLIITRMSDNGVILDIDEQDLDFWRGENASHFVRPKWGIYRSIVETDNLRPDEEWVRFANFSVSEVMPVE